MVRKDVVRWTLDKAQKELIQHVKDFDEEDPFADIVPEQDGDSQDSTPLVITDED